MGRKARERTKRLAEKLLQIRSTIDGGLSQEELIRRLGLEKEFDRTYISKWEGGVLEPPLRVLLRYGGIAGVIVDVLADDSLDLPINLPGSFDRRHLQNTSSSKKSQKR